MQTPPSIPKARNGNNNPNHSFNISGMMDVSSVISAIPAGHAHGVFSALVTIYVKKGTEEEVAIPLEASTYGNRSVSLIPNRAYNLSGRFLALQRRGARKFYFHAANSLLLGEPKDIQGTPWNKILTHGCGIVMETSGEKGKLITAKVRHVDYDSEMRTHQPFLVEYHVHQTPVPNNVGLIFRLGREVTVVGALVAYERKEKMFVVNVATISWGSGDFPPEDMRKPAAGPSPKGSAAVSSRGIRIMDVDQSDSGDEVEVEPSPAGTIDVKPIISDSPTVSQFLSGEEPVEKMGDNLISIEGPEGSVAESQPVASGSGEMAPTASGSGSGNSLRRPKAQQAAEPRKKMKGPQ